MLVLDFINVGNGDSILVREMEGERLRFSMLVDCGHDSLERDDHPPVEDPPLLPDLCRGFPAKSRCGASGYPAGHPLPPGPHRWSGPGCWRPSLWASC